MRLTLHAGSDGVVMAEMARDSRSRMLLDHLTRWVEARDAGRLSAAVLRAELEARRRIARELHDSVPQHLVIIDLALSRLRREAGDALAAGAVDEIGSALRAAHSEVRTFSYLLHPPDLERFGLAGAIEAFATGFGVRTGLVLMLVIDELPVLDAVSNLTLLRIAQEALVNVHRHAQASRVDVSLRLVANEVELVVADDGVGVLQPNPGSLGIGLSGMQARLQQLEGRLRVDASAQGFRLRATLPVRPG